MSGHSKWSTIKHKKAITDSRRGQMFTKLARAITIAARDGGDDENFNFSLRLAIEKAKQFNMPKANIDRAVKRGVGKDASGSLAEMIYEGFGPEKTAVMVMAVTDNKNRANAEIRKIFETSGGVLGQSGAVNFMFKRLGKLLVEKQTDTEDQVLKIMDLMVEEVEEETGGIEVTTKPNLLKQVKDELVKFGFKIKAAELVYVPTTSVELDKTGKEKLDKLVETLEELDDVQTVFTNGV